MSEDSEKNNTDSWKDSYHARLDTQGHQKLIAYLNDLKTQPDFKNDVEDLRKRQQKGEFEEYRKKMEAIDNLCLEYGLDPIMCEEILHFYVFEEKDAGAYPWAGMCMARDKEDEDEDMPYTRERWGTTYPVVLRISPYASKRDILDYVKKMYKHSIAPRQEKYRRDDIKLGKIKQKNPEIQKRNHFIYENRDKPRKEIASLVAERFDEYLDVGHISKIISLEKKKRK